MPRRQPAKKAVIERAERALREAQARREAITQECNAEIAALSREVRLLKGESPGSDKSDPAKVAGPANVERVRDYLRWKHRASQAEVAKALNMNTGTVTWAFRALAEDGAAEHEPGDLDGRSKVWTYIEPEVPDGPERPADARRSVRG